MSEREAWQPLGADGDGDSSPTLATPRHWATVLSCSLLCPCHHTNTGPCSSCCRHASGAAASTSFSSSSLGSGSGHLLLQQQQQQRRRVVARITGKREEYIKGGITDPEDVWGEEAEPEFVEVRRESGCGQGADRPELSPHLAQADRAVVVQGQVDRQQGQSQGGKVPGVHGCNGRTRGRGRGVVGQFCFRHEDANGE